MRIPHPVRCAQALAVALLLAGPLAASAQGNILQRSKGTLQPTPPPTGQAAIPSGTDLGTGPSSKSVPLGTPTVPANDAEREDLKRASAAARAAARRRAAPAAPPASAASAAVDSAAARAEAAVPMSPRPTPKPARRASAPR